MAARGPHAGDWRNLLTRCRATPGQILVTRATHERVRDWVDARSLGPYRVKGKQQEVEALGLLALWADRAPVRLRGVSGRAGGPRGW